MRFNLIKEEVEECSKGVEKKVIENITKELFDVLYCVYGTILEYRPQDVMEEIF
ncbi:MAG: hypothetical protein ACMXYB_01480 [Candidatus Woesearchaeota archaeon]